MSSNSLIYIGESETNAYIYSKCEFCYCFGAHSLMDNSKTNILIILKDKIAFIIEEKYIYFMGSLKTI